MNVSNLSNTCFTYFFPTQQQITSGNEIQNTLTELCIINLQSLTDLIFLSLLGLHPDGFVLTWKRETALEPNLSHLRWTIHCGYNTNENPNIVLNPISVKKFLDSCLYLDRKLTIYFAELFFVCASEHFFVQGLGLFVFSLLQICRCLKCESEPSASCKVTAKNLTGKYLQCFLFFNTENKTAPGSVRSVSIFSLSFVGWQLKREQVRWLSVKAKRPPSRGQVMSGGGGSPRRRHVHDSIMPYQCTAARPENRSLA